MKSPPSFWAFPSGDGGIGKVILVREPQTPLEIVKSADTRGIHDEEAGKDGMEMVFFEVSGPLSIGRDLELNGKKDGTEPFDTTRLQNAKYISLEEAKRIVRNADALKQKKQAGHFLAQPVQDWTFLRII